MPKPGPVERIRIRLPAERGLSPIVRAAVLYAAHESGLAKGAAERLAAQAGRRFEARSRSTGENLGPALTLAIDLSAKRIEVRIDPGRGRKPDLLRASRAAG